MMRARFLFASLVAGALAQSAAAPAFEVASVKPVAEPKIPPFVPETGRYSGGPGTKTPGKFECREVTLKSVLARAFNVPPTRISGPDWLDNARYDIAAKLDPETTPENFRLMLQALLAERFSLRFHRETRSTSVYLLTVAKNGPKLQPVRKPPEYQDEAERKAAVQASMQKNMEAMKARIAAGGARSYRKFGLNGTAAQLAETLSGNADREVLDLTEVKGEYYFQLSWTPDAEATGDPSLFAALQEQLGLKLQAAKEELEVIVIDHAERTPTGN
jgi:uncharacterized protein (TIGR03435 family)